MQYLGIGFFILAIGASVTVQQCNPNEITESTNNYFAFLQSFDNSMPTTLYEQSVSAQHLFNEMVNVLGIAGDIPWAVDVLRDLLNGKATRLQDYLTLINVNDKQYFYNVYLPAIRVALGKFQWDPEIQSFLYQMLQNRDQRLKYADDHVANLNKEQNILFDFVTTVILDINRRAVAARNSGQMDLSAYEYELKALQNSMAAKLAVYTTSTDNTFNNGLKTFILKLLVIVNAIKERCLQLL